MTSEELLNITIPSLPSESDDLNSIMTPPLLPLLGMESDDENNYPNRMPSIPLLKRCRRRCDDKFSQSNDQYFFNLDSRDEHEHEVKEEQNTPSSERLPLMPLL